MEATTELLEAVNELRQAEAELEHARYHLGDLLSRYKETNSYNITRLSTDLGLKRPRIYWLIGLAENRKINGNQNS